jgi:DNA polymerase (family 10)
MTVSNEAIAELFENMGTLLEMKGDTVFKTRAYQRAARTIEQLSFPLERAVQDGMDLTEIPGIGRAISDKIKELLQTGQVSTYQRLLSELPDGVLTLLDIPGIGPKTAMLIAKDLGVSTIQGVEQAARDGRMAALPKMGGKQRKIYSATFRLWGPRTRGPQSARRCLWLKRLSPSCAASAPLLATSSPPAAFDAGKRLSAT